MRRGHVKRLALLLLLLSPLCGCGRRRAPPAPVKEEKPDIEGGLRKTFPSVDRLASASELRVLYQHYIDYNSAHGKSPSRLEDLAELKRDRPRIYKAIEDGVYVVQWNASLSGSGQAILAYVRDAPTKGGEVLLMDGSAKNMTAEEIKAAPKAGQQ